MFAIILAIVSYGSHGNPPNIPLFCKSNSLYAHVRHQHRINFIYMHRKPGILKCLQNTVAKVVEFG